MAKRSPELEARRSELIVLFLLMQGPLSGYKIRSLIRDWQIERYMPVSPATVYRALERLAQEQCVGGTAHRNGRYPVSKVYAITPKGKRRYRQQIHAESAFVRTAYSLDAFLGMTNYLTARERKALVTNWQRAASARIVDLDARINDKVPGRTYGKAYPEWLLLDHERDILKAELVWMDKYIKVLVP